MARKVLRLNQSALFRIRSFKRLALILNCPAAELEDLAGSEDNFMEYENKNGRWIEAPKPRIKRIHRRFAELLAQIETPPYLHSAVRKRSYITNAAAHTTAGATAKIDIKKFYNSARAAQVHSFLVEALEWEPDVAGMMTRLLTTNGHLPTGGNASPILSFWVYRDLFDAVDAIATAQGSVFSLYVDDMTITGRLTSRATITEVRKLVGNARLRAHKVKFFPPGVPKIVTGVAQTPAGQRLPFARQVLLREARSRLRAAASDDERFEALKPLVGRLCEASEVDPGTWLARRNVAIRAKLALESQRSAEVQPLPTLSPALIPLPEGPESELAPPWPAEPGTA